MRPIVAGMGSLGEKTGRVYTGDTIAKIQDTTWTSKYSWLSCDVVAFYPSIPPDQALVALHSHLVRYSLFSRQMIEFIVLAVEFLLRNLPVGEFIIIKRNCSVPELLPNH